MSSRILTQLLRDYLAGDVEPDESVLDDIRRVETYEEAGTFSRDDGLVIRMRDGTEFHITVTRSK